MWNLLLALLFQLLSYSLQESSVCCKIKSLYLLINYYSKVILAYLIKPAREILFKLLWLLKTVSLDKLPVLHDLMYQG